MKSRLFLIIVALLIGIVAPVGVSARGQIPPPPPYTGGGIGAWLGEDGSGPLFGFDDPWGKDMPFGIGGAGTPGFTGWLSDGNWTRGSNAGSPFGTGGGGGGVRRDTSYGCPWKCQSASMTGPCVPLCYCRP